MDDTDSESKPLVRSGITSVEPLGSAATKR